MKLFIAIFCFGFFSFAQVGIKTTNPHPSSILDLSTNSGGLLLPRMTLAQRNAIASPAEGLMVYNLDSKCFQNFKGGIWSPCMAQQTSTLNMDCPSISVNGYYVKNEALRTVNTISLNLYATSTTNYEISTNILNGYSFSGSGVMSAGLNTITLAGSGTPILDQIDTFTITFAGMTKTCSATVHVSLLPPTNRSCKDLLLAGNTTSGVYSIDPDGLAGAAAFPCYCDMTNFGGGWALVFAHNIAGGYWAGDIEADQFNISNPNITTNKYSILYKIDVLRNASKYEFRMNFPSLGLTNHWEQTFDPRSGVGTASVAGFVALAPLMSGATFGGIAKNNDLYNYLDGNPNSNNFYYSIGNRNPWNDGIGGLGNPANLYATDRVLLFIR